MNSTLRSWAKGVLQLLLTLGITWFILNQIGVTLSEILDAPSALPRLNLGWLLLSGFVLLLAFLLSARSWGWMVAELGDRDPGAGASIRVVLLSNLGRYLPGKFWQIAGLAILARKAGTSATLATAAAVLGQCFGLAAAGIVALPALFRVWEGSENQRVILLSGLALILALAALSTPRILRSGLGLAFRIARLPQEEVPAGSASFGPRWLTWHLGIWAIYGAAFLLFIQGVGFNGGHLFFASAFAAAYLLGYLAIFAPAGFGVREGVLIALLRPEVGGSAVGIAVLARLWITIVEVLPAGVLALQAARKREGEGG